MTLAPDLSAYAPAETTVRRLRRMKALAAALLLVAAAVFVLTYLVDFAGVGFVRAAAEAAMVGGLADWFAITAIFRRPLGLPIPHTALIPSRKDQLAESLGSFMTDTFLTQENVGQRLTDADVIRRVATWLVDPANTRRLAAEVADAAIAVSRAVDPDEVADLLLATARTDAARRGYAPLLGRLLQTTVQDDGHQALIDIALRSTHTWMHENRAELVYELQDFADGSSRLLWLFATTKRVDRIFGDLMDTVDDAAGDRNHPLRRLLDRFLLTTADQLQRDATLGARVNEEALRVLDDPALREWLIEVVDGLGDTLRTALSDPDGAPRARLIQSVQGFAQRVLDDGALRSRLDQLVERSVFYAIDHYADEFTALVVTTVERWDGAETARRIEQLAGRDLQFIRINGTVVGALAGLAIHGVAVLLP